MAKNDGKGRQRGNRPNPNKIKPSYSGNLRKKAAQEVDWANRPAYRAIDDQQRDLRDQYDENYATYGDIQRRFANDLADVPQMREAYGDISEQLNENMAQLGGNFAAFSQGPLNAEGQAAAQVFGNIGAAGHAANAGLMNRNIGYTNSVRNQGAADLSTRRASLLETFRDEVQRLRDQRMGIVSGEAAQRSQTLQDMRSARTNEALQIGQYNLNREQLNQSEAAQQAMIDYLQGKLSGRGGGGGGGGGDFPGQGQDNVHQSGPNKGRTTGETAHQQALAGQTPPAQGSQGGGGKRLRSLNNRIASIEEKYPLLREDNYGEYYYETLGADGKVHPMYVPNYDDLLEKRENVRRRRGRRRGNKPTAREKRSGR